MINSMHLYLLLFVLIPSSLISIWLTIQNCIRFPAGFMVI